MAKTIEEPIDETKLNTAERLARIAKKFRDEKGQEESTSIKDQWDNLLAKIDVLAAIGAIYYYSSMDDDSAIYKAVSTKSGIKLLLENGFRPEIQNGVIIIWWDEPKTIEAEAADALKPISVDPIKERPETDPATPISAEPAHL